MSEDLRTFVVVREYFFVTKALGGHDGRAYLAQSHSVSPAVAFEDEDIPFAGHVEPGALEVGGGEQTAYRELLAHGDFAFAALDHQARYAA